MANTEVGSAYVTIMPSMKGFQASVSNEVSGASGALSSFSGVAKAAAVALASIGLATAAKQFVSFGIETASAAETTEISLTTMLGSAEAARDMLEQLSAFAARTPFELSGLNDATRQLLAYGFSADEVIPMLTAVGDATSALGTGQVGIESVTRALGQMQTRGKVSAEEMLQLTEAGIPAWEYLARAIGTDTAGAMEQVSKGAVDAATGISALTSGMEQDFGGMMEEQSKTLTGVMSNLSDAIQQPLMQLRDTSGYQALTGALSSLAGTAGDLVAAVLPALDSGMSAASSVISGAASAIPTLVSGMRSVASVVGGAVESARMFATGMSDLWALGDTLPEKVSLAFQYAVRSAQDGASRLARAASDGLVGILGAVPALRPVADAASAVVDSFGGLSGAVGAAVAAVAGIRTFSAVSPVIGGVATSVSTLMTQMGGLEGVWHRFTGLFSSLGGIVPGVASSFSTFSLSVQMAGGGIGGVARVLAGFVSPVTAAIAAVTGLAAGFAHFYATSEDFRSTVNGIVAQVGTALKPVIDSVALAVSSFVSAVMPSVQAAISAVLPVLRTVIEIVAQVAGAIATVAGQMAGTVVPVITTVLSVVLSAASAIATTVAPVIQGILSVVQAAVATISAVVTGVMGVIQAAVSSGLSVVQTAWNGAWSVVSSAVGAAWEGIKSTVSAGIEGVVSFVSGLPGRIQAIFADAASWLVNAGRSIIEGLVSGIQGAISGAVSAVSGALGAIRDLFPFSPAKAGPFSGHGYTTWSGRALMRDWADSMADSGRYAVSAVDGVVGDVSAAFAFASPAAPEVGAALGWTRSQPVGEPAAGGRTTIEQVFNTRVVRADEDLYAVAPIIYRNATREARLMST